MLCISTSVLLVHENWISELHVYIHFYNGSLDIVSTIKNKQVGMRYIFALRITYIFPEHIYFLSNNTYFSYNMNCLQYPS